MLLKTPLFNDIIHIQKDMNINTYASSQAPTIGSQLLYPVALA